MLQRLILSVFLLTNTAFGQSAQLISSTSAGTYKPFTSSSFTQRAELNSSGFDPAYKLEFRNAVQDKNFYLLSLFQRQPEVGRLLRRNPVLKRLSNQRVQALRVAAHCDDVGCFDRLFRFSDPTIERVATELRILIRHPEFRKLVRKDMRPSGAFIKHGKETDSEMLIAAWKDAANGMNRLLSVYGLGKDPFYKDIDRVSFDVSSAEYRGLLKTKLGEIKLARTALFFEPTLSFALKLLEANRRDEAGRYEPLEEGENKASIQGLKDISWSDYPYSFILVLGSGPPAGLRLSKIAAKRADQGAQLFLEHKAPLIILSGGHVHPMQTPFNEAIEMKKYLMEKFKIPEKSILIDPYARHTTTNFRNAARLAIRYGIPNELKALVTSSEDHIAIVTKDGFRIRCSAELGYFPVEFISRVSPLAAEFKPSVASLFFDANDPLDP
ncbi:MAG TPA: YdcF family protein [Pyrinomonadaceae bacterium]|nr:YdcF family protein [Pyrinomonadaceae bacterium]